MLSLYRIIMNLTIIGKNECENEKLMLSLSIMIIKGGNNLYEFTLWI